MQLVTSCVIISDDYKKLDDNVIDFFFLSGIFSKVDFFLGYYMYDLKKNQLK